MNNYRFIGLFLLLAACNSAGNQAPVQKATTVTTFIGTYTRKEGHVDGKGAGIYVFSQDSSSGYLDELLVEEDIVNPSFLIPSHDGKFLYAAEEIGPAVDTVGHVVAYAWDGKALQKINSQSSHAFAPCHLSTDSQGRYVFVANYVGGTVAILPIDENGGLKPASDVIKLSGKGPHARQDSSHPHSVNLSPDEKYLYVPDLGTDRINIFQVDYQNGKLVPANPAFIAMQPGAGPRHFTFHPVQSYAYVINELNNTITALRWQKETGALDTIQSVPTLPADFQAQNTTSDIHITPNGQFLYGANRGHNSIAGYKIDVNNGQLTPIGHTPTQGEIPRNFAISPDGRFLYAANQNSDNILIFKIGADGQLQYQNEVKTPTPVCVQFVR
ncbi:MAG: lactonase family protein [Saprospiraceae bacterium]